MKRILIIIALFSTVLTGYAQKNKKNKPAPAPVFSLQTDEDSLSYAIGILNFQSLSNDLINKYELDVKIDILSRAMADYQQDTTLLSPEKANEFLGNYMMKVEEKQSAAAKSDGIKFLEENKLKPGIKETPSGLQYEIIELGTGEKPLATDRVKVDYTGTLINGKVFDSSVERGEPIVFVLNQVIPGWTEGVQLMPVGSKFKFYIPSELAYGARAAGALIKPYSTLIFEVNLIGIEN